MVCSKNRLLKNLRLFEIIYQQSLPSSFVPVNPPPVRPVGLSVVEVLCRYGSLFHGVSIAGEHPSFEPLADH